jgi:hypothetical protein
MEVTIKEVECHGLFAALRHRAHIQTLSLVARLCATLTDIHQTLIDTHAIQDTYRGKTQCLTRTTTSVSSGHRSRYKHISSHVISARRWPVTGEFIESNNQRKKWRKHETRRPQTRFKSEQLRPKPGSCVRHLDLFSSLAQRKRW